MDEWKDQGTCPAVQTNGEDLRMCTLPALHKEDHDWRIVKFVSGDGLNVIRGNFGATPRPISPPDNPEPSQTVADAVQEQLRILNEQAERSAESDRKRDRQDKTLRVHARRQSKALERIAAALERLVPAAR